MFKRRRIRMREIDFDKVEEIKRLMKFTSDEIAELLGVRRGQYYNYRACGKVPANRYYALRDALLVAAEEEARELRERVLSMFDCIS